jgi:hypothetical protein
MAVVAPAVRVLFCEGKPQSYDYGLLNRLVTGPTVHIQPVGSKHGLRAFIEGYLANYSVLPTYLAFRDRDFDVEPPSMPGLIPLLNERGEQNKPIWMTYRSCVESYFIDSMLLHDYWQFGSTGPKWRHGAPPDSTIIKQHICEAAKEISGYQAIRWALARLKPGLRWAEIKSRWTDRDGVLPPSCTFEDCLLKAKQLVNEFAAQVTPITTEKLEKMAVEYNRKWTSDFYQSQQFLVWFHGKDLLEAWRRRIGFSDQECQSYIGWAIKNLDIGLYPDLVELRQRCMAWATGVK